MGKCLTSNLMICIGKCVSKNIIIYYLIIMADVIAIFWADVIALFCLNLKFLADVMPV